MADTAKSAKEASVPQLDFDIIVVGGGLVGASAAVELSTHGFRVALVDRESLQFNQDHNLANDWDNRIYAISPGNAAWLDGLDVWGGLDQARLCPIERMEIFGDVHAAPLVFDAYEVNALNLGVILENRLLLQVLWRKLEALGVHVETSSQVESLVVREENASISLKNGGVLNARLIIGADGGNSWVRRQSGVSIKIHDYQQMGLVANFGTELPHGNIARQWFTENGVLAWLPLPGNRISIVWSTDNAAELMELNPDELADKVSVAGAHALGILQIISETAAFKLVKQTANQLISPRIVLVGDAAHQIHPLAGQGVNLGFRDVIVLSEVLKKASKYEDIGDAHVLRRYERARQADILALGTVTHGLHWLFESQSPIIKRVRNFGLGLTSQQRELKSYLIRQAIA